MNYQQPSEAPVSAAALAQMGRHPGPFMLTLDNQQGATAQLGCDEVVRAIPGKRLVCSGAWQGQSVYIKVYMGPDKYWQAECRGLQALHAQGIAAPALLHAGTADHGALHVIVLAAIEPAQTLACAWEQVSDKTERIRLLRLALLTLAMHHRAGLEQSDIHLNNFLLSGERLYTLDGGGIRPGDSAGLSTRRSRDNLAWFFAQFYPRFDELIEAVLPDYAGQRGWPAGRISVDALRRRVRHFRRRRQRHFLKKIFRDCSAFVCQKDWRSFRVCDRSLATPELQGLLADPDASLQWSDTRYLKQGNTCTLWTVSIDGRPLVVKRYNIKGLAHRLGRLLRRTRASTSWKNAHRLAMYGIHGARPVALYERRFGLLRGKAWLIMEYLGGADITQLCKASPPDGDTTRQVISDMTSLLAQLAQCRISHGDMKGTNFIQSSQGIAVIDLDAMCEHRFDAAFKRAQQRDLQRFLLNWQQCPAIETLFRESLQNDNRLTAV